jgi:hypothetical protein
MTAKENVVRLKASIKKRLTDGLDDLKSGRIPGPFSSDSELIRSLRNEAQNRKKGK